MKLDGIKRGLLFVLPILFGVCVNSCFGYTQIDDCYIDRTNGNYHGTCRDYSVNESFNSEGATVSYGAYLNTPGNSKTFLYTIEGVYNSKNWRSEYYLFYRDDGYVSIFQGLQNLTDNNSSLYVYTGNGKYCVPIDNINVCGSASKAANTAYTKTIEEVNSGIDGAIMTGYKILYNTVTTSNLPYTTTTNAICPMFDNGFVFCMPLRSDTNPAGTVSNLGNYGLGTRTNIFSSQAFTNIYDYINTHYTISETPLTVVAPSGSNGYFDSLTVMGGAEQIYNAYVLEGYERAMCYGGYPLTDIVDTTNGIDLSGFKSGTGASLNEIYEATSGGLSKVDRYNSNFAYFTYAYRSNDYNVFNGDPYALLGLMSIKQIIKPGASASSVVSFCDLVQNGVWSGSALDLINESVENLQYQQLIGEIGVNIPASGSAIDLMVKSLQDQGYLTGFSFSTVFSGGEEESITTIRSRRDELYEKISGGLSVPAGFNGILPGYIAMGFLAFLLLYLFKK